MRAQTDPQPPTPSRLLAGPRHACRAIALPGAPIRLLVAALTFAFAVVSVCARPDAAGAAWLPQPVPVTVDLFDVTASHGNIDIAWACGASGTILFTSNGGMTWTQQETGTIEDLFGIAFQEIAGGPVLAVGAGGVILRTTDMGTSWSQVASGTGVTLRCLSDFGFLVVGDGGTILQSTDSGLTWNPMSSGTTENLHSVSGAFSTYAVGDNGTILAYHLTSGWFARDSGTTADLFGTPLFGASDYVVGDGGLILRSTTNGVSWTPQTSGTAAALRAVEFSVNNTSRLYTVGDAGVILKTTDHGATWGFQDSGTTENLHAVFFYLDDLRGWAVGENGTMLRTNDGGGPPVLSVESRPSGTGGPTRPPSLVGYPNPFRSLATFDVPLDRPGRITLDLFDACGRHVAGWHGEAAHAGEQRIRLEVDSRLPAGVYIARLQSGDGPPQTIKMLREP